MRSREPKSPVFNPYALWVVMARRRLTAPELAQKLSKRTSKINRFLLGISEPSDTDLENLARVLDWPIGFFRNTRIGPPDWSSL